MGTFCLFSHIYGSALAPSSGCVFAESTGIRLWYMGLFSSEGRFSYKKKVSTTLHDSYAVYSLPDSCCLGRK